MKEEEKKAILLKVKKEPSTLKKQLLMTALISKLLEEKGKKTPIIVGGCALSYYSREVYSSFDVDLVYDDQKSLKEVLSDLGFKKEGRYFISCEYLMAIEVPSSSLNGDEDRIEIVKIGRGLKCKVIGIEDIIIDRLNACKYWKSKVDCEMAELLIVKYKDEIDWGYLFEKSKEPQNDTEKEIRKLKLKANEKKSKKV